MPKISKKEMIAQEKAKAAESIAALSIYLSGEEKEEIAKSLGISSETIRRYGNGEVAKLPAAIKLLNALRAAVAKLNIPA